LIVKLTQYSKNRFYKSFQEYDVPKDYADPIYNYFVYGFQPGGFFTAMLANDFMGAISRSHPANTVQALKLLVTWLENSRSKHLIWGDYPTVERWMQANEGYKRAVLESIGLIYSEEQEIWMTLKGEKDNPVVLF
jgi:hypothetical protein